MSMPFSHFMRLMWIDRYGDNALNKLGHLMSVQYPR